jgi:hypothetical protein
MNERIKELEKLATPRCYDETGCYIGNRFDVEKFAELIIREYSYDVMNLHGASPERIEMAARHWKVEL